MGKISAWLYGLAMGAGLMYFLDPQTGNQRKANVRNQVTRLQHQADEAMDIAMRDARNRVKGLLSEGIALVSTEGVPDYVLEQRVRSRLGYLTRHPGALQLTVNQGELVLDGDILADESDALVKGITKVRGIRGVQNNLRVHQEAGNLPNLQGEGWLPGQDRSAMQWSPTGRMLAGAGAGYLLLYGTARGGLVGLIARLTGIGLGLRALANMDMRTMAGKNLDFEAVRVRKTVQVNAPIDEVYALWSNFENFSQFMANIDQIVDMGGGRSHWVVKGPAGSKVEFDAMMKENIPNERVAWETLPNSSVQHKGFVRFREMDGSTQINVQMDYTPPAGVAGHAVAKLFGKDPKTEMDADLQRLKNLLERGKTRAESRQVTREEVLPVTGERSGSGQGRRSRQRQNNQQNAGQSNEMPSGTADQPNDNPGMSGVGGGPLNTGDF